MSVLVPAQAHSSTLSPHQLSSTFGTNGLYQDHASMTALLGDMGQADGGALTSEQAIGHVGELGTARVQDEEVIMDTRQVETAAAVPAPSGGIASRDETGGESTGTNEGKENAGDTDETTQPIWSLFPAISPCPPNAEPESTVDSVNMQGSDGAPAIFAPTPMHPMVQSMAGQISRSQSHTPVDIRQVTYPGGMMQNFGVDMSAGGNGMSGLPMDMSMRMGIGMGTGTGMRMGMGTPPQRYASPMDMQMQMQIPIQGNVQMQGQSPGQWQGKGQGQGQGQAPPQIQMQAPLQPSNVPGWMNNAQSGLGSSAYMASIHPSLSASNTAPQMARRASDIGVPHSQYPITQHIQQAMSAPGTPPRPLAPHLPSQLQSQPPSRAASPAQSAVTRKTRRESKCATSSPAMKRSRTSTSIPVRTVQASAEVSVPAIPTIQHLLPESAINSHTAMAQSDLMRLFVPSLMMPGYPSQIPLGDSGVVDQAGPAANSREAGSKGEIVADSTAGAVPPPAPASNVRRTSGSVKRAAQDDQSGEASLQQSVSSQGAEGSSAALASGQPSTSVQGRDHNPGKTNANLQVGVDDARGEMGGAAAPTDAEADSFSSELYASTPFRALFEQASFQSLLHDGSGNGAWPISPYPGAEWLNFPETPLKTARTGGMAAMQASSKVAVADAEEASRSAENGAGQGQSKQVSNGGVDGEGETEKQGDQSGGDADRSSETMKAIEEGPESSTASVQARATTTESAPPATDEASENVGSSSDPSSTLSSDPTGPTMEPDYSLPLSASQYSSFPFFQLNSAGLPDFSMFNESNPATPGWPMMFGVPPGSATMRGSNGDMTPGWAWDGGAMADATMYNGQGEMVGANGANGVAHDSIADQLHKRKRGSE